MEGYSPWGRKELDMTEQLHFHFSLSLPLVPYAFFKKPFRTIVPDLFGTRNWFCGRHFFHGPGQGDGFEMIQEFSIYYTFHF